MEKLGVEPTQLLTQVFNFAVMVILLTKFLYKPILKSLNERRQKIQEGLEYAEKMKMEMEKTEKKRQEIIDKADDEAKKIIEESIKAGKKMEAEIIRKAQSEAESIIQKGRQGLEMERQEMEKELRSQTVEIAKKWVEAVLGKVLGSRSQQEMLNKKILELSKLSK